MSKDPSSAEMEVGVLREEVRRLNDIIEHLNRHWGPQVERLEQRALDYSRLIENLNLLGGLERDRLEERIEKLEALLGLWPSGAPMPAEVREALDEIFARDV